MASSVRGERVAVMSPWNMQPGQYGRDLNGCWWVMPPVNEDGRPEAHRLEIELSTNPRTPALMPDGSIAAWAKSTGWRKFDVTEHEDGTVSVFPAIEVKAHGERVFYGYLVRGRWVGSAS